MVKIKDTLFCVKNLKMKRKKNILTLRSEDLNPRFSVTFPPIGRLPIMQILEYRESPHCTDYGTVLQKLNSRKVVLNTDVVLN